MCATYETKIHEIETNVIYNEVVTDTLKLKI